jgi:hypothetical protein
VPMASPEAPHRGGFFQRMVDKPGGRQALLAFGQSMLTSPDFFSGLGNGGVAYQKAMDDEEVKSRPQLTKDQEFAYKYNPATGKYDFNETAAGARNLQVARAKLDASTDNAHYKADRSYDGRAYSADRQYNYKDRELGFRDKWEGARNVNRIDVAKLLGDSGIERARVTAELRGEKPVPGSVLAQYGTAAKAASTADAALELGGSVMDDMQAGTLDLGLLSNLHSKFSQATGVGTTDNTRAYARYQQFTQQLVNVTLMDAKGVQTDGDAIRARIMTAVSSGDTAGAQREVANAMQLMENSRNFNLAHAMDISGQYHINTSHVW